jgi:acetoin utilization deacetylase AcuC-like enzyme
MNNVGFIYHPDYLKHDTGSGHPERPDRLRALVKHLLGTELWKKLHHLQPTAPAVEWLTAVHPESYVKSIEQQCRSGVRILDFGDTRVCRDSYDVALLAVGGVLLGVDRVISGELSSAFCAVRPPGHHAETQTAMGFCLFNNVAVGARYAQKKYGLERVAILDWDVHHGNGTQEIFYDDPTVLYISLHQYPYYPGSGAASETGSGAGVGYTVNCPMPAGSGWKEYEAAFRSTILPALHRFQPQLLMISAGFDAHRDDPLAHIQLTDDSFAEMTKMMMEIASAYCNGKIVSVLEGGYHLEALARSVERHLQELAG